MLSIVGNLTPCIKDGNKAVIFNVDSTKSDFDFPENEKKIVQDKICELIINDGYKYYYTKDKQNVISMCPYKDKIINSTIQDNNGEITLTLDNGSILKFEFNNG